MRWLGLLLFLPVAAFAAEPDLSVAYIGRTPKIDYVWESSNPRVEGWPAPGSEVRWVANVRWLGSAPITAVDYRWLLDGTVVSSGQLDFQPESLVRTELPWTWTFERHEIVFEIDWEGRVAEIEERNNRLLIHTDALAIGFYVEQTYWDVVSGRARRTRIGATTVDDWLQRLVRRFNEMARYALFDETPQGVLDRWRIDAIHVVPDGALPLSDPYVEARDWGAAPTSLATLYPHAADHSVDMQWGFPAFTAHYFPEETPWIFLIGNSLIHELAHARTMIDTYAWNVMRESDVVELRPGPGMTGFYYYASTEHGMMHFDWGHIDRYTAVMMNAMAGQRARRGNYNEPWDLGWFLDDIPAGNRVQFLRYDGRPVANTPIRIYRAKPAPEVAPYAMRFSAPPDFNFTTDGEGRVTLPANVFADDGITAFVDRSNGVAVVELLSEPQRQWAFLESLHFNLAWHRGHRDMAEYTVTTNRPACPDGLGPSASRPEADVLVSTPSVTLQFPVWFERRYRLFYAVDGGDPVSLDVGPFTDTPARITLSLPPGRINWWFVDLEPPFCPPARSSLFAFDHELLDGPRRRAVGR